MYYYLGRVGVAALNPILLMAHYNNRTPNSMVSWMNGGLPDNPPIHFPPVPHKAPPPSFLEPPGQPPSQERYLMTTMMVPSGQSSSMAKALG